MQIPAKDLAIGDLVDLAGDKVACRQSGNGAELSDECVTVVDMDCSSNVCAMFDSGHLFEFPSDHSLTVYRTKESRE